MSRALEPPDPFGVVVQFPLVSRYVVGNRLKAHLEGMETSNNGMTAAPTGVRLPLMSFTHGASFVASGPICVKPTKNCTVLLMAACG
jgi:hypothetical protein